MIQRSIIVTVPFHTSTMQFHELLLVVLTMPWSTSFPLTCITLGLTNLSRRLSRNGPKKLFHLFGDVLAVPTGTCSESPVPTDVGTLPPTSASVQTLASPQGLSQSKKMTNLGYQRTPSTNPMDKKILKIVINSVTKQLTVKLRMPAEKQKYSTRINLRTSSQHQTPMMCGKAFNKPPSTNRNIHPQNNNPDSVLRQTL